MKYIFLIIFCSTIYLEDIKAQQVVDLYNGDVPGNICHVTETKLKNNEVGQVTKPTMTVFIPQKQNDKKAAVLIMPGGGYDHLAIDKEGFQVAKAFNTVGIVAFVLKYRLPSVSDCFKDKQFVAFQDAEQAMMLIRKQAGKFNIDPENVGVIGFSAGGHLAAMLLTNYQVNLIEDKQTNLKPSWGILAYPVISMADSLGKTGTKKNLIGLDAAEKIKQYFSADLRVNAETPKCFVFQAQDDPVVSVQHSLIFYEALVRNKVPAQLHIYQNGGHGFGLHNKTTTLNWFDEALLWLTNNNYFKHR
ncbi:alpha/beta hydrolase [Pedobacter sp. ISL-68]|uniref:alpha/beta hydrolase n=1 Tax=unclassified Pedobacter TaxID=2628915 RepID=UPI001BEA63CF|nr:MULTISPECIES: alpha/beta hydrolase [unclassified Pedobacter]MBT2563135.1 alpha/beta hydrolase [Pedobacter sp. ISL-64]MBT2593473.1 alpha/beta hydrolase [Pedobacter sp. ISL-68]